MGQRLFYAYATKSAQADDATGIGIEERDENDETVAIYSLYYDKKLSRRRKAEAVVRTVINELAVDEFAKISGVTVQGDRMNKKYVGKMRLYNDGYLESKHEQARQLAADALTRKTTIIENLKEAIQ